MQSPTVMQGYFNPNRSGHGMFLSQADSAWALVWYTYLEDGTPTWYLAANAAPGANAGKQNGRDHNNHGFTMWLAGGGVKPGLTLGASDDFGFNVTQDKVHVHDLHATILHLLGFDHTKLTYRFQGRDYRLTDVAGKVVGQLVT